MILTKEQIDFLYEHRYEIILSDSAALLDLIETAHRLCDEKEELYENSDDRL